MSGLARQHALQMRERGIEVVATLLEHRAQDENRDRRLDKVPPWRQRRLSIALVTRVALALSERDVSRRQRKRAVQVRRVFGKPRPRQREHTHPWIARRGQALQDRVVIIRDIGLGRARDRRHGQQQAGKPQAGDLDHGFRLA